MKKVQTKAELKAAKESFYNKAMQDPKLREYTKRLATLSTHEAEYHDILDEMFAYLDVRFQIEIGLTSEQETSIKDQAYDN